MCFYNIVGAISFFIAPRSISCWIVVLVYSSVPYLVCTFTRKNNIKHDCGYCVGVRADSQEGGRRYLQRTLNAAEKTYEVLD